MKQNIQIDDESATLKVAYQIGIKGKCIPSLNLPITQNQFRAAHWKLAMKYFTNKENKQIQQNKMVFTDKSVTQYTQNRTKTSCSFRRSRNLSIHHVRNNVQEQNFIINTTRSSFSKRSNNLPNTMQIQMTKSWQIQDRKRRKDKNLLFQIWNPENCNQTHLNVSKHFDRETKFNSQPKERSKSKSSIRIKFNSKVKSFQFY